MRRAIFLSIALALAGCHAHTVGSGQAEKLEKPPSAPQVSSERPVRTTPGGMLDPKSVHEVQHALARHGLSPGDSGQLDASTERALREFQRRKAMAVTGLPDYDTLRALGLDPKQIYVGGVERRKGNRASR